MHDDALKFALSRRGEIEPFIVMDIMRDANAREESGSGIIHMEVGQPSTPAPRLVREAAKRAIDSEMLGYTDANGIPALRERIARHYREMYGVPVDAGRVIVTTGSSSAFVLAFLALFDAGARIALPRPGYPCYRQIAGALGLETVRWMRGGGWLGRHRHGAGTARRCAKDRRPAHGQPRQSDGRHADAPGCASWRRAVTGGKSVSFPMKSTTA
jgi:hypothetical protein